MDDGSNASHDQDAPAQARRPFVLLGAAVCAAAALTWFPPRADADLRAPGMPAAATPGTLSPALCDTAACRPSDARRPALPGVQAGRSWHRHVDSVRQNVTTAQKI